MDYKCDYYETLEVNKNASKEEIRAAYRRLAKLHHPDRNHGNSQAEEKFKLINEAHEILINDIFRHEYDEYRRQEEEWNAKQKEKKPDNRESKNKRTYQKKKTVTKESRIYIRGKVLIKYWADQEGEAINSRQHVINYKINPAKVSVDIIETDIHPLQGIPMEYLKAFKESELFKTSISQPVKCSIHTSSGVEYYELDLRDIRIKNIKLEGITKHEGISYGTLNGDIYAYTAKFNTYEEIEEVTECFGETGKVETKIEEGTTWYRKEYYHPDCTTYWSNWYAVKKPEPAKQTMKPAAAVASGCWEWWWIPFILLLIVLFPKFILVLLALVALGLIFSFFGRVLPFIGLALFLAFIIFAIRSFSDEGRLAFKHDSPSYDSLHTSRETVKRNKEPGDTSTPKEDTLITHFIRWTDYNNSTFETNLSISVSDLRASIAGHQQMDSYFNSGSLAPAYAQMVALDANGLHQIYSVFDSIRSKNNMGDIAFAQMIVSCIQSIPYFLVLDNGCSDDYDNEFIKNYLISCTEECCIGYQKFGVRTPIEFLSDLKGDCDTRAVLLYGILKHFNYNVALITSEYYLHAMIAVNFSEDYLSGLSMNIGDKNYLLWETTASGFNAGQVPVHLQNLDYWNISLLNQNN